MHSILSDVYAFNRHLFSMLFEINIDSNPGIALDNLVNLLEIDSTFIIILANEIIQLSTIHQEKKIDYVSDYVYLS